MRHAGGRTSRKSDMLEAERERCMQPRRWCSPQRPHSEFECIVAALSKAPQRTRPLDGVGESCAVASPPSQPLVAHRPISARQRAATPLF